MRRVPLLCLAALVLTACGNGGSEGPTTSPSAAAPTTTAPGPSATATTTAARPRAMQVSVHTTGLEVPWDLAVLPDGQLLVTERGGQVRLVGKDGSLQRKPVAQVEVSAQGEGGLLGIALDPEFGTGQRLAYLYVTTAKEMQVQRWRVAANGVMTREAVVLGGIRAGRIHDSGRLRFGPDDQLYVLTGDAGEQDLAQDRRSLNGKVLRLTRQQYRASTTRPTILSLGHRNPQGLDWQPGSDRLVITDHGPSGLDSCCDEVDVIVPGANYGWPEVFGKNHGRFTAPAHLWQKTVAPSGAAFVSAPGSSWTGSLLVGTLRGQSLRRLSFQGDRVTGEQVLFNGTYGRLRAVVEAPDGSLFVTTSNRDGRGDPIKADDRILRIMPPRR